MCDTFVTHSLASLSYVNVCIDEVNDVVRDLHDSGAQISIYHPRVVEGLNLPCEGTIKLRGLVVDAIDADLVSLVVKLPHGTSIPVLMAMSPKVNNDLVLTDPVVKSLQVIYQCTSLNVRLVVMIVMMMIAIRLL